MPARAPTTRTQSRGRTVRVCKRCRKTAFATEEDAIRGVGSALRSGYLMLRPYLGDCGWWHLTKQLKPKFPARVQ